MSECLLEREEGAAVTDEIPPHGSLAHLSHLRNGERVTTNSRIQGPGAGVTDSETSN